MATQKTTTPKDEATRMSLAHEASGDIEALVGMMRRELAAEPAQLGAILCNTLLRVLALNSVIMSVIGGDDTRSTAEMFEVIHGEPMEAIHG